MQDTPDNITTKGDGNAEDDKAQNENSHILKARFYTRNLVSLCCFLWVISFLAFLGAEWLNTRRIPLYVRVVPRPPRIPVELLRIASVVGTLGGLAGWWGALHQRHGSLFLFSCIIFLTSVVEISFGSVTLSYTGKVTLLMKEYVVRGLNGVTDPTADASSVKFLELHEKIGCCGVDSYRDWIGSPWWKAQRQLNSTLVVPDSCCKNKKIKYCNKGNPPYKEVLYPKEMQPIGCMSRLSDYLDFLFYVTGGIAFMSGCVKFFGFYGVHYLVIMIMKQQEKMSQRDGDDAID